MKDLTIGCFLYINGFPIFMLVTAIEIVIEGKLWGRMNLSGFSCLANHNPLPFLLSLILEQMEVDF